MTLRTWVSLAVLLWLSAASRPVALAQSASTWSFAVSGDSRNCGDVVMPGIAAGVHADNARFYWHLGDFRVNHDFDQDILASPAYRGKHLAIADYQRLEWPDFIAQQLDPFGSTPVFLAIGNHELEPWKTRLDYIQQFADWIDSPVIRAQRLKDDPHDHQVRTYYHWIENGVEFISLDNASGDQFDDAQIAWTERTLDLATKNPDVRTVVVGMHDALPDSISAGHSMNETAQMQASGRRVYQDLLAFRAKTQKRVYVLASHSHFLVEDPYNNACHSQPETLLPGWIVGTAGAVRYRLPADLGHAKQARTDVYGYLLGTVQRDGEIKFQFKEVKPENVPASVTERYGSKQVQYCFQENKSPYTPSAPSCPLAAPGK